MVVIKETPCEFCKGVGHHQAPYDKDTFECEHCLGEGFRKEIIHYGNMLQLQREAIDNENHNER